MAQQSAPPSSQAPPPSSSKTAAFSFPSPGRVPTHEGQFKDAVAHIKSTMRSCDPAVLRQAIRELWELTLVGSDYHYQFVVSTMLHRAPVGTLSRTIESHGSRLVANATAPIAKHLQTEQLDNIAPLLLPKLSHGFLDKALALRLETIQAQQLVNALGRAERLGYDVRDVVTGNTAPAQGQARQEKVIPTANPIPVPPPAMLASMSQEPARPQPAAASSGQISHNHGSVPTHAEVLRLGLAFCEMCRRPCGGLKSLIAHRRNGRCGSLPPPLHQLGKDTCIFCGQKFTSVAGLKYHTTNAVCGIYSEEVSSVLFRIFQDADAAFKKNTQTSAPAPAPAPTTPTAAPRVLAPTPLSSDGQANRDPYSHLTPEQRRDFDAEMARTLAQFETQVAKYAHLPPEQQRPEILRLKNGLKTKESLTRKKYGIRLRERRSKQEVEEERTRLLGSSTPVSSTGKRPHIVMGDTEESAGGGRDSVSREGTPSKRINVGETEAKETSSSPLVVTDVPPPQPQPQAPATVTTARPMPMGIAGSYTAPLRQPKAPMAPILPTASMEAPGTGSSSAVPIDIADEDDGDKSQSDTAMDEDSD